MNLNQGWQYLEQDASFADLENVSQSWKKVDLPHTWNAFDATDEVPGYRRSGSWYRRNLTLADYDPQKNYLLYFEGANLLTDVYVNNQHVGTHIGGYVGFSMDISAYLRRGANLLLIRVDNSANRDIIPSQKSDFIIFGGLVRDLWLQTLPKTGISLVHVKTPEVSEHSARTVVAISFIKESKGDFDLEVRILDADGRTASQQSQRLDSLAQGVSVQVELPAIANPRLWSPDHPSLYVAEVTLKHKNEVFDRVAERFGYRWFEFKEHGPFYLNGRRLLLRGTHRHEDHAGYGIAMPNEQHRRDIRQIKEMGANFIRLGHYPQDPEVYKACDELGLLVWDELPWCRGGAGGSAWKQNTMDLLKAQIAQNFNHPSIIIWSMGNEIYVDPDFEGGADNDSLRGFLASLNRKAHELDPGRLTAIRKYYEGADLVDVFSPSIWAGWYSGPYEKYEQSISEARDRYPRFLHAEYGGSSHIGRHANSPVTAAGTIHRDGDVEVGLNPIILDDISDDSDWSESYQVDVMDWHLHISERLDWFAGNAQWAFKDFATPLRPENPIPYINQKGLVDRAGNPKDAYYVFKSYWTREPKFVYIESHTWPVRVGKQGEVLEVSVYSNCQSVELKLNGESLGRKDAVYARFPAHDLTWKVPFNEGDNRLTAIGYDSTHKTVADTLNVRYYQEKPGEPASMELSARRLPGGNWLVEAKALDAQGRQCVSYNNRVYFSHSGTGRLLSAYGTPTGSRIIEMANGYAAIEFEPGGSGMATIGAMSHGIKESFITIEAEEKMSNGLQKQEVP